MLQNLTTKKDFRSFSVCPENPTGEKGKAAMATEGIASAAAEGRPRLEIKSLYTRKAGAKSRFG